MKTGPAQRGDLPRCAGLKLFYSSLLACFLCIQGQVLMEIFVYIATFRYFFAILCSICNSPGAINPEAGWISRLED